MESRLVGSVRFESLGPDVVILRMPAVGSVADVHLWYDEVERLLAASPGPVALVHDLRAPTLSAITAGHRQAVAERTHRLRAPALASKVGADARIFGNAVVAGALTAVSWLTGETPWPQGNFADEEAAIAWSRAELARLADARAST